MQVNNFIKYLEQPLSASEAPDNDVNLFLKKFPYCQSGQLMLAIQLKRKNSILFDQQLKTAAAYCTDRNQLFNQLQYEQQEGEELVVEKVRAKEKVKFIVEEEAIIETIKEVDTKGLDTLEKEYLSAAVSSSILLEAEEIDITKPENKGASELEKEVVLFDKNKGHSFSSWLKHYNGEDAVEENNDELELNKEIKQDLIDRFIQEDPKIQPKKTEFYSPINMARLSVVDESDIVSETLALIYVDQRDYQKAIDAYKKLSLKNPEKSSYFASQIKILNQKIK